MGVFVNLCLCGIFSFISLHSKSTDIKHFFFFSFNFSWFLISPKKLKKELIKKQRISSKRIWTNKKFFSSSSNTSLQLRFFHTLFLFFIIIIIIPFLATFIIVNIFSIIVCSLACFVNNSPSTRWIRYKWQNHLDLPNMKSLPQISCFSVSHHSLPSLFLTQYFVLLLECNKIKQEV